MVLKTLLLSNKRVFLGATMRYNLIVPLILIEYDSLGSACANSITIKGLSVYKLIIPSITPFRGNI